jgi:hypothetical protein
MSIYDEAWGAVDDPPRRAGVDEQRAAGLTKRNTFVPAHPPGQTITAQPLISQPIAAADPYAQYAAPMAEVRVIHQLTPEARGRALFQKTLGVSLFLWGLTLAALAILDGLSFMVWLFFAALEGFVCFVVFAVLDYREHPMYIRKLLATGYLRLMSNEQTMRHVAQHGTDLVRQARELDR